tara:strand:+ start:444 stop:1142 length:699 start_codon:yes stop_codon:yes gene_type:complete
MNRPIIAVSKPRNGGYTQNLAIRLALFLAGAKPINITPAKPNIDGKIQGLVLAGGTDVMPQWFDSNDIKTDYRYDKERDKLEIDLIKLAKLTDIPMLCICRGAQLLNVFEGGSLFTDIEKVYENANYPSSLLAKIFFRKKIIINKDSKLHRAFKSTVAKVNSMHTQSIDKLGMDLKITSKESNGIVQSIEHQKNNYIIGVQFHPEFLIHRKDARSLFFNFVNACKKGGQQAP